MAMVVSDAPASLADVDIVMTFWDVGPDGLDASLRLIGDRPRPRILYQEGDLTLVTPSPLHEGCADSLDEVVKNVCIELDIDVQPTGSTLFRRKDLDRGIMADKSYYIEHAAVFRKIEGEIDLDRDPPPDLAIEVVVTHPARKAVAICRALGIPEVWVFDAPKKGLTFLHLDANGQYVAAPSSRAFPFLTAADVVPWVESPGDETYNQWSLRLRTWVRDILGRRRAGMGGV